MRDNLAGKRVAILATDGVEQSELLEPLGALREAGAEVQVVGLQLGQIQGMSHADKGEMVDVTVAERDARALSRAENEGMIGGAEARIDEIRHTKRDLDRSRGQPDRRFP